MTISAKLLTRTPSSPDDITLNWIISVVRTSHKYDVVKHQTWALVRLTEMLPGANDTVSKVYTNPYWPRYKDVDFLLRLLNTTVLLSPKLDGIAALAYYSLAIADWEADDQAEFRRKLSPAVEGMLIAGQRKLFLQNLATVHKVIAHRCSRKNHCGAKDTGLKALTTAMNGDFLKAATSLNIGGEWCWGCQSLVRSFAGEKPLYEQIAKAFGFNQVQVGGREGTTMMGVRLIEVTDSHPQ